MRLDQFKIKIRELQKIAKAAKSCSNVEIAGIQDDVQYAYDILCEIDEIIHQDEIDRLLDKHQPIDEKIFT